MADVVIIQEGGGDWCLLVIDGERVYEGHEYETYERAFAAMGGRLAQINGGTDGRRFLPAPLPEDKAAEVLSDAG